jgi:1-acyl-sn-glycerol-3-phosphate acyltransferase
MMERMDTSSGYDAALARAAQIYPGMRIGRPGRARTYWATIACLRLLRVKVKIDFAGGEHVAPGPAILVGNHLSTLDPVVAVMSTWWRITAFTKAEWFEGRLAPFFRLMGQIPLRRGDDVSTEWALDMAARTLAEGNKVGIYPEGTRGPDHDTLYRLHQRVLIPLIVNSPDVPVHAIATTYTKAGRRTVARVRISPRLAIEPATMSPDEITAVVREGLLEQSGLTYVNQYAFVVKAKAERAARAAAEAASSQDAPS